LASPIFGLICIFRRRHRCLSRRARAVDGSILRFLLAWLANALIVLPWIGEGIAGSLYLSADGMIYFAAAHTAFFMLLALLYARFSRQKKAESAYAVDAEA